MSHATNKKHGYISLHRSILDHWIFPKRNLTQLEAFIKMLMTVNHKDNKVQIGNEIVTCKRGESLNSLDSWSRLFGWHKSKTRRFFDMLEKDKMIVRKSTQKTTHLTICNYDTYQSTRHFGDTLATPNNNDKEIVSIISYLNEKAKKNFSLKTKKTNTLIGARLAEGFSLDDFLQVIDTKVEDWLSDLKMNEYLRPETLFGNKFESYLNKASTTTDPSKLEGKDRFEYLDSKGDQRTQSEEIEFYKLKPKYDGI